MPDDHKNFAYSLVATAPTPDDSGTSLIVTSAQGTQFPTPPFQAVIWPTAVQALPTNAEVVTVTVVATDTFTIVRAQEGSTARHVVAGDQIAANITDKTLTDLEGNRLPAGDSQVRTGYSLIVSGDYEVPSGFVLDILDNAVLEIT
jgi:hypothetical protein